MHHSVVSQEARRGPGALHAIPKPTDKMLRGSPKKEQESTDLLACALIFLTRSILGALVAYVLHFDERYIKA